MLSVKGCVIRPAVSTPKVHTHTDFAKTVSKAAMLKI